MVFNIFNNSFNGYRIVESLAMTVYAGEDWSKVRSPGRAMRRRKKHRQNITAKYEPSKEFIMDNINRIIYCHPEMAKELYRRVKNENNYVGFNSHKVF